METLIKYIENKFQTTMTENDIEELENILFSIEKHRVCSSCYSLGISNTDCVCVESNKYPTTELEFKHCNICYQIIDYPIDSEFNNKQTE